LFFIFLVTLYAQFFGGAILAQKNSFGGISYMGISKAYAQQPIGSSPRINTKDDVYRVVDKLTNILFALLLLLAVGFIMASAYYFLTAGGNPDNSKKGRTMITYTLIAVAVGAFSKALVYLVASLIQ